MALKLLYDWVMRRLALLSLAFAPVLIAAYAVPVAYAQVVNWGPSVTSMGFGGNNRLGGVPPSVTSLGFGQARNMEGSSHHGFFAPMSPEVPDFGSRHHRPYQPVWGGYYAYPIYVDSGDAYNPGRPYQDGQDSSDNFASRDEYRGGPTIFDRRGDGQYPRSVAVRPSEPQPEPEPLEAKSMPTPQPVAEPVNQPETILIFKDGHQTSIGNYAIVGSTLYDLSGGKRHKIALADLDLTATARQNDDRGVDFELPVGSTPN